MFCYPFRSWVATFHIYTGGHCGPHPPRHVDISQWSFHCERNPGYDYGSPRHGQCWRCWRHNRQEHDVAAKRHAAQRRHVVPFHVHRAISDRQLQRLADKPDARFRHLPFYWENAVQRSLRRLHNSPVQLDAGGEQPVGAGGHYFHQPGTQHAGGLHKWLGGLRGNRHRSEMIMILSVSQWICQVFQRWPVALKLSSRLKLCSVLGGRSQ